MILLELVKDKLDLVLIPLAILFLSQIIMLRLFHIPGVLVVQKVKMLLMQLQEVVEHLLLQMEQMVVLKAQVEIVVH